MGKEMLYSSLLLLFSLSSVTFGSHLLIRLNADEIPVHMRNPKSSLASYRVSNFKDSSPGDLNEREPKESGKEIIENESARGGQIVSVEEQESAGKPKLFTKDPPSVDNDQELDDLESEDVMSAEDEGKSETVSDSKDEFGKRKSGNQDDKDGLRAKGTRSLTGAELDKMLAEVAGRNRTAASLGKAMDFPTDLQSAMDDFELDLQLIKVKEFVGNMRFRGAKNQRSMSAKVKRWPHKEKIDSSEPDGCGYPICAMVDMRPKRFVSMCQMASWMEEEGNVRRIFEVQKGSCEDAIERKGLDRPWISSVPMQCNCEGHKGCNTKICINDNGHAKTFSNVCEGMKYLATQPSVTLVAVGLGSCRELFSGPIFTEWFDLDDPCQNGEVESVYATNLYAASLGKQGPHRSCANKNIIYPAQFQTTDGKKERLEGFAFELHPDRLICINSKNSHHPQPPYYWNDKTVKCPDFRIRYACKNFWGEAGILDKIPSEDAIVDPPYQKTLFDDCIWKNFMSFSQGEGVGDVEIREQSYKLMRKSTCQLSKFSALFIDARRVDDDLPWDETGELITKNTPMYGFYCDNKNNEYFGKKCSNYKVRYCCKKEKASQWGRWSSWTECSKTCGGGTRSRNRVCVKKEGHKRGCFNDGPHGEKRFREMTEMCNPLPCPRDLQWQPWQQWSACSVSCGQGKRRRVRGCFPAKGGGEECPPPEDTRYFEEGPCHLEPCRHPQWLTWSSWTTCSTTCGLGTMSRSRKCVDIANGNELIKNENKECPGPAVVDDDCFTGHCPVDGGWTPWQSWGECSVACGDSGFRTRRRYCTNPFPLNGGKECPGIAEEQGPCKNLPPCPQHCLFSAWGEWTPCSVTCGDGSEAGTRTRQRFKAVEARNGGLDCIGSLEEVDSCIFCKGKGEDTQGCIPRCPVDCVLSSWTEWAGTCPRCYTPETKEYVTKVHQHRMQYIEKPSQNGGNSCEGKYGDVSLENGFVEETKPCKIDEDVPKCPEKSRKMSSYWSAWKSWGPCEASCGQKAKRTRIRQCLGHGKCPGKEKETEPCVSLCPSVGWAEWEEWSPCEKTCGKGQSSRRRICRDDESTDIFKEQRTCKGIQRETRECDAGPCDTIDKIKTVGEDVTGLSQGACVAECKSHLPVSTDEHNGTTTNEDMKKPYIFASDTSDTTTGISVPDMEHSQTPDLGNEFQMTSQQDSVQPNEEIFMPSQNEHHQLEHDGYSETSFVNSHQSSDVSTGFSPDVNSHHDEYFYEDYGGLNNQLSMGADYSAHIPHHSFQKSRENTKIPIIEDELIQFTTPRHHAKSKRRGKRSTPAEETNNSIIVKRATERQEGPDGSILNKSLQALKDKLEPGKVKFGKSLKIRPTVETMT